MPFSLSFRVPPGLHLFFVWLVGFGVALLWQWHAGARAWEYGGHPDEAAHFVTGLMIRDYIAAGFPGSPMAYADEYYAHYPKIGLGVWPPVFYLVQAVVTLPFGPARDVLLGLQAALAAGVGVLLYRAVRPFAGIGVAAAAMLIWLSTPLVRDYYSRVMAEMLCALWMFAAVLAWSAWLERGRARDAFLFAVLAAVAILTKGTGLALAIMAPLALALERRWSLLRRPALWGAVALVAVLAGPWTWVFRNLGRGGWEQASPSMAWSQDALAFYSQSTLRDTRAIIPLLVIFGALATRRIIAERTPKDAVPDARQLAGRGVQVACAALVISVFVFQLIVPAGREARHMIPIIAPLLVLAAAGLKFFHSPLSRGKEDKRLARWLVPLGATVCVLVSVQGIFDRPPLGGTSGLQPLAKYVILDAAPKPVLVSSDATGEGMFIAEVARWDLRRPFFRVARTSKALASSEWNGSGYKPKFSDDATLLKHLQSTYSALVLDPSMPPAKRQPHHDHLDRIVAANPAAFTQIATSPITRSGKTNPAPAQLLRVNPGQD